MSNPPISPGSGVAVATDELATNITGTVAKNGTATLTGTSTTYTSDLIVGQVVRVPGGGGTEDRIVSAIASDTSLTVSVAFANTASGQTAQRITQAQFVKLLNGAAGSASAAIGQQTMANSLPAVIASDQSTLNVALTDTTATGTITANGQTVSVAVSGHAMVGFVFSGTFAGVTVVPERSTDGGATWIATPSISVVGTGTPTFNVGNTGVAAGTTTAIYVETSGSTNVRLRATAYTSGTATVSAAATVAAMSPLMGMRTAFGGDIPAVLNANGVATFSTTASDGVSSSNNAWRMQGFGFSYNESSWDRQRGNTNLTILSSAARTTTQTSADQTNYNHRGVIVVLDMTVVGTGSVTITIQGKDNISGKYYTLLAGAAVTTNVTNVYTIYPGLTAVNNVTASAVVPRTWNVIVTANNANSCTYSVGASVLL